MDSIDDITSDDINDDKLKDILERHLRELEESDKPTGDSLGEKFNNEMEEWKLDNPDKEDGVRTVRRLYRERYDKKYPSNNNTYLIET